MNLYAITDENDKIKVTDISVYVGSRKNLEGVTTKALTQLLNDVKSSKKMTITRNGTIDALKDTTLFTNGQKSVSELYSDGKVIWSRLQKHENILKVKNIIKEIMLKEERIDFDRADMRDPYQNMENKRYKIVRMAYDDEGTNVVALLDKKNKKVISYSVLGQKQFADYKKLSTRKI
jgi:hypothetical protein